MSIFSSYKKIFLLGFIIVILIAIPFSVYIAQKRQQIQIKAATATTLSLTPAKPTASVGDTLSLDIILDPVNPGPPLTSNQVSFVKLVINFDSSKFTTLSNSLTVNPSLPNTLTTILEDPVYTAGTASISLSIGADPTKVLSQKATIATLKLKALAPTDSNNPTPITFDKTTQVLSIAPSDQASENVLSTTNPANATINGISPSPTPTPTITIAPTPTKSSTTTSGISTQQTGVIGNGPAGLGTNAAVLSPTINPNLFPSPTFPPIGTRGSLPPTGPGEKIVGLGIIGTILTVLGGALLISL